MILLLITILIGIGSVLFLLFAFIRLHHHRERHPLPENKYTLLLGFIGIRHVMFLHAFSVAALVILSASFVLSLHL